MPRLGWVQTFSLPRALGISLLQSHLAFCNLGSTLGNKDLPPWKLFYNTRGQGGTRIPKNGGPNKRWCGYQNVCIRQGLI